MFAFAAPAPLFTVADNCSIDAAGLLQTAGLEIQYAGLRSALPLVICIVPGRTMLSLLLRTVPTIPARFCIAFRVLQHTLPSGTGRNFIGRRQITGSHLFSHFFQLGGFGAQRARQIRIIITPETPPALRQQRETPE